MSGRGSDPRRERGPVFGVRRQELMAECLSFLADIGEVDGRLGELAGRRRGLVKELQSRRVLLMPVLSRGGGRAPVGDGLVCLPPVDLEAPALWGRRLRASCVALLGGAGELSLSELHVLLHLSGFRVDSSQAVKALSDAMAYECEQGRAVRVARGVYAAPGSANGTNGVRGCPNPQDADRLGDQDRAGMDRPNDDPGDGISSSGDASGRRLEPNTNDDGWADSGGDICGHNVGHENDRHQNNRHQNDSHENDSHENDTGDTTSRAGRNRGSGSQGAGGATSATRRSGGGGREKAGGDLGANGRPKRGPVRHLDRLPEEILPWAA